MYVDMNHNGKRDNRETVTQAWRRLGLLKSGENFDRGKYLTCVQNAAMKLRKEGIFTDSTVRDYVDEANKAELPAQ